MQEHKVPHYRVMLGLPGIPDPLTILAPCSAQDIAEQVRATVEANTSYVPDMVEVDLRTGLVTVRCVGVSAGGVLVAVGDITGPGRHRPLPTGTGHHTAPADPKRAALVAGLRELADWYAAHPDMPMPAYPGFRHCVLGDDDAAGVAEVERIAEQLGMTATRDGNSASVKRQFGGVAFEAFYVSRARSASYAALTSYRGSVVPETSAESEADAVDEPAPAACEHPVLSDAEIRISGCRSGCKVRACSGCGKEVTDHSLAYGCRVDVAHAEALAEESDQDVLTAAPLPGELVCATYSQLGSHQLMIRRVPDGQAHVYWLYVNGARAYGPYWRAEDAYDRLKQLGGRP